MRLYVFIFLFFGLIAACRAKDSTPQGIEEELKKAMQTYLYNAVNNDSTNVKYNVQDVTYFEDTEKFICEFKVQMKAKLFDTTGIMKAHVSKDFKQVNRLQ